LIKRVHFIEEKNVISLQLYQVTFGWTEQDDRGCSSDLICEAPHRGVNPTQAALGVNSLSFTIKTTAVSGLIYGGKKNLIF
jgi:hypothetical protein